MDPSSGRVFKATYGRRYGLSFTGNGDGNALDYLRRVSLCNRIFNTELRFEGVWLDRNELRIVVSQPFIYGDNTPLEKITDFMRERRFEARTVGEKTVYYRSDDNLVVADLHEQNVLESSDGKLVPIDVIIGKPGPDLERVLRNP
jgi:Serine/Threonine/Tyrosine Kinase found in polyvalent proteins